MENIKIRAGRFALTLLLALALAASGFAAEPAEVWAADVSPGGVWVVPEVISGARQPAKGGMFAWVTFDYSYDGDSLAADLDTSDFTLQKKTIGSDWEDQSDTGLVVMGGEEVYIASFEAIIAAKIPANTDPFIKKWRLVYKKGTPEEIEGEVIVQAADLPETSAVTAVSKDYCADFRVEEVPWSYEEYQKDSIPPIYIAYVYPDVVSTLREPGLKTDGDTKIVIPNVGTWQLGEKGLSFGSEYYKETETEIRLNGSDKNGISELVSHWKEIKAGESWLEWPGDADIPDAGVLYRKIASAACVPDENADEYLSYIVDGTNIYWVHGANTEERMDLGVKDHLLVVVRDYEALGTTNHSWSSKPEWEWTGSDKSGYTKATATFRCANHEKHISIVPAVVRSTDDGEKTTYTAFAVFNGNTYTDTKAVKNGDEEDYVSGAADSSPAPAKDPSPAPSKAVVRKLTLNCKTINAKAVKKALAKTGSKAKVTELVAGKSVRKINAKAFKGTNVKTLVVKSKKLSQKSVKNALKGSKIKTVKVQAGNKKTNKKYIKKYRKIFTKKNAGKSVKVK